MSCHVNVVASVGHRLASLVPEPPRRDRSLVTWPPFWPLGWARGPASVGARPPFRAGVFELEERKWSARSAWPSTQMHMIWILTIFPHGISKPCVWNYVYSSDIFHFESLIWKFCLCFLVDCRLPNWIVVSRLARMFSLDIMSYTHDLQCSNKTKSHLNKKSMWQTHIRTARYHTETSNPEHV